MRSAYSTKALRALGVVLTIASLVFIANQVYRVSWPTEIERYAADLGFRVSAGIFIYAAAGSLLAYSWWRLIRTLGDASLSFREAYSVYATTQIYKYLPSNLVHFVGRHLAGTKLGVRQDVMAVALAFELIMLAVAAGIIATSLIYNFPGLIPEFSVAQQQAALTTLSALSIAALVGGMLFWVSRRPHGWRGRQALAVLLVCQAVYLIFFLVYGLIGILIVRGTPEGAELSGLFVMGSMCLAWVLGFLVPGAPAGMGVRETVIVWLLSPDLGAATALVVALSSRVVTLVGDVAFALLGFFSISWSRPN